MAYTGIGVLALKKKWIKVLQPMAWWGGTIKHVDTKWYTSTNNYQKFELWTPNLIWAVSLAYAIDYINKIWWYKEIRSHEQELIKYTISKFRKYTNIQLLWTMDDAHRVGSFSFCIKDIPNFNIVWEHFANHNICVRCGWHCAHPLHHHTWIQWTCRMSLYIYNTIEDIDKFFEVLELL